MLSIRKISPVQVVISSYASKVFIQRSGRSRFDYRKYIGEYLLGEAQNSESTLFKNPSIATVVRYDVKLPWMYTVIANTLASFEMDGITWCFDYNKRVELMNLTKDELKAERKGAVIIARHPHGVLSLQDDGEIILVRDQVEEPFNDIERLLKIDVSKTPLPMAEIKVFAKEIPLGVALSYLVGLSTVLKLLRAKVRRTLPGERMNLESYEFAIKFKNETLIFDSRDRRTTLLMSGWKHIQESIKLYDYSLFDQPDVYAPVLDRSGIQSRYLKELDTMNIGFLDPISRQLLKDMGEPTEFVPLLIRGAELILDEYVPLTLDDPKSMIELPERIRGYERIPGAAYEVLYKAMRSHAGKTMRAGSKIVVNPQDVLNAIITDPTVSPINNINSVHSLREREVVTFGGKGGRSKLAMTANTRLYTNEDKGFISEATVDSGDVGVITYLAPNANLTTIRGTVRLFDEKRDGNSMLFSTSAQLAPASDGDIPKRQGFISIQLGHQIATRKKDIQSYRTGGERSMIGRMGKEFGAVASDAGKVIEKTKTKLVVKYQDGKEVSYRIGSTELSAEGTYYPHTLTTQLALGDSVKKGDVLYYNDGFFVPSPFDPKKVDYCFGVDTYVAFREANYTIEDSCAIDAEFAEGMSTSVTKVKSKLADFDQDITNVLKVGEKVDLDSPLFQLRDAFTQGMDEDELTAAVQHFAALSPSADVVGIINRVEVFYNGEIEEMSESLRELTLVSEKKRKQEASDAGETFYPNKVNRFVRIDGTQIESKQALIVYHITINLGMGISDKLVFANQLKSTVGKVLFGKNRTLHGERLDAIFGALSGINRTVTSVYKTGGVNTYLRYVGEETYTRYFG